ncbi:MAG: hypothetical protein NC402_04665 [Prevotella sp.]|nr:hypothetical protein [Prevotella sp.]
MRNLKDVLIEVANRMADKAVGCKAKTIVLRLDSLVAFDAAEDFLSHMPGISEVYGTPEQWLNSKHDEPVKLLLTHIDDNDMEMGLYTELQRLAKEQKADLVVLEMLSDLKDEDFVDAEVIPCLTERALTVGELYEMLDDPEIADKIAVYEDYGGHGVTFAKPDTRRPVISNQHFTSVSLEAGIKENVFTVREFADFLKQFDKNASLSIAGKRIITGVDTYYGNVTAMSTLKASGINLLSGMYLRIFKEQIKDL